MAHRVFETKFGRVALTSAEEYFAEGFGSGSMGSIAKQEGADMVLLVKSDAELASCTEADVERMVGEILRSLETSA